MSDIKTLKENLFYNRKNGRLTVKLCRSNEEIAVLTVTDTGVGIPEQSLPHIFDAFYRADPARNEKISGSGLGLAIVSRAVRNMGGRIIAKNAQPHGLTLEIQLPRLED